MIYYFGCWNQAGHDLHEPGGKTIDRVGPFDVWGRGGLPVDGCFAPGPHSKRTGYRNPEDEEATALTHIKGWTVLAMWDRSIDTRGACNAAFLHEGIVSEMEMWNLARLSFPKIVLRLRATPTWARPKVPGMEGA